MTEADAKKFDALEQAGFGSRTDIIRIALDRMYREEIKTMNDVTLFYDWRGPGWYAGISDSAGVHYLHIHSDKRSRPDADARSMGLGTPIWINTMPDGENDRVSTRFLKENER